MSASRATVPGLRAAKTSVRRGSTAVKRQAPLLELHCISRVADKPRYHCAHPVICQVSETAKHTETQQPSRLQNIWRLPAANRQLNLETGYALAVTVIDHRNSLGDNGCR